MQRSTQAVAPIKPFAPKSCTPAQQGITPTTPRALPSTLVLSQRMLTLPRALTALALGRTSKITFSHLFFLWEHLPARRSMCRTVYKPVPAAQVPLCPCSRGTAGPSCCLGTGLGLSGRFVHAASWCPAPAASGSSCHSSSHLPLRAAGWEADNLSI